MKNNKGFSLVELIVVIAIMAILAAVAVVGVSIYVPKAQQAADEQMISDVEDALILGAYSKLGTAGYMPGSVVGAVGLNEEANASFTTEDWDNNGVSDIQEIMVSAFGEDWATQLRLQSETFSGGNRATILKAMQDAKKSDNYYFDSIPDSSFYAKDGNTEALVSDVDEIASALYGVLDGVGSVAFSKFWGEDFHNSIEQGNLKDTWNKNENDQMAANLTVFAAANQIQNIATSNDPEAEARMTGWINSWNGEVGTVNGDTNGYCADLVMQYGQCVAFYNYIKNTYPASDEANAIEKRYEALEKAMAALNNPKEGYVQDFNKAIDAFWFELDTYRKEWQTAPEGGKSQAQKDAEALLASMTAVNSLESDYVNKSQSELLNSTNAFEQAGAAGILDTMVAYAKLENLPEDACAVILVIDADGTPIVYSPLQDNETK